MKREKFIVSFAGFLLSIVLFLLLLISVTGFNISAFVLSPRALDQAIQYDELAKKAQKSFYESTGIKDEIKGDEKMEEFYEEVFTDDSTQYLMESLLDAAVYGEDTYDSDEMHDLIEDSTESFFEEHPEISSEQKDKYINDVVDATGELVSGTIDSRESSEIFDAFDVARANIKQGTVISGIAAVVIIVLLFVIYSQKPRAISKAGTTIITSQIFNALAVIALKLFLGYYLEADELMMSLFGKIVENATTRSLVVIGVVFAIGIAFKIIGMIWASGYSKDADNESKTFQDYPAQMPVQMPVQVPAPAPVPVPAPPMPAPVPAPAPPPPIKRN